MTKYEELEQLQALKNNGSITETEFEIEKQKVLNSSDNTNKTKRNKVVKAVIIVLVIFGILLGIGGIANFIYDKANNDNTGLITKTTIEDIQIPDLVGLTIEEAENRIKGTELTITVVDREYNSKIGKGKIIAQDPAYRSNKKIKNNTNIKVIVSLGNK